MASGKKPAWFLYVTLTAILAGACAVALSVGAVHIAPADLLRGGIGQLRVSRVLLTIVVGAGLSVAGVIFQALLMVAFCKN